MHGHHHHHHHHQHCQHQQQQQQQTQQQEGGEVGAVEVIDSVWKACAYGDIDKLRELVKEKPQTVNQPDEQGYYPMQWAALNNRVNICEYLIEMGCNVKLQDQTGQSALHWTGVRGSLSCLEILLRNGADVDQRDQRGYAVTHVAAQYGQTAILYHLSLRWEVDIDSKDLDGRTPLHWAAYKGFADTIRLLLVLDARFQMRDKEGCTPLHWAAIKGNAEACTVLMQGGSKPILGSADVTGNTPEQLAMSKGHRLLAMHLQEIKRREENVWMNKKGTCGWFARVQLAPVIWAIIIFLFCIFLYKVVGGDGYKHSLSPVLKFFAWIVAIFCSLGCFYLYKTNVSDPGFLPRRNDDLEKKGSTGERSNQQQQSQDEALRNLDCAPLWSGHWSQLCVTCKIVRPLRAKHDPTTDRCIEVFDHYCPWVGNAIGKGNRHYFIIFLWLEVVAMSSGEGVAIVRLGQVGGSSMVGGQAALVWTLIFVIFDAFMLISVLVLAITQTNQAMQNITTNEAMNWHRYNHMLRQDGHFRNPFDKGWRKNLEELCYPARFPRAPFVLEESSSDFGFRSRLGNQKLTLKEIKK
eukprot:TRINITY_DN6862_c0_g1_i10.p1 TRINITY_DN6862_c0_g1~~TRINITY_DN6862_c0_g1_i10.p1  ORF type:complete len:578 (+),score=56.76 TRINITY_DN6862_c0_g1_i10:127-1860(+)